MKRSKHSLSHYKLGSAKFGYVYPFACVEVLPGDSFQHATSIFCRVAPLVTPVMHPVHINVRHFFVPSRLLWKTSMEGEARGFVDFITGGEDGNDASIHPTIKAPETTGWSSTDLAYYLGVPPNVPEFEAGALQFRGYNMICNEYYRDQDLVPRRAISFDEGEDTVTDTTLFRGAWQKDYFTSARPWEQKGPTITIPLSGTAPVETTGDPVGFHRGDTTDRHIQFNVGQPAHLMLDNTSGATTGTLSFGSDTGLQINLDDIPAIDLNDLRAAASLQRFQEARARFGSEYVDYLNYLGIKSSDARLQRPEYLGGGTQTIQFSEVLATAENEETPIGALKGHGIGVAKSRRYRRFFEEHGFVYTMVTIRPIAIYADGCPRSFLRRTKNDYWQKEFEHIGQQAIKNAEVYAAAANPDGEFGWQDRYDEYRRHPSSICGEYYDLLKDWHLARLFEEEPVLNGSFVSCNPDGRIFASEATDGFYIMCRHSIQARRLVSKVGNSYLF